MKSGWYPPRSNSRRFFVLEVDDAHANDTPYFAAIWQQMESGGYEAMLHELLHYNLAEFNVRRVPTTDGLQTQRKLTLGTSKSWWLDVLQRGYVFQSKLELGEISANGCSRYHRAAVHELQRVRI